MDAVAVALGDAVGNVVVGVAAGEFLIEGNPRIMLDSLRLRSVLILKWKASAWIS